MSPLLFLTIPVVVFAVGSSVLYLGSRFRGSGASLRNAPDDLRMLAPALKDQRETGFPVSSGHSGRR
jgi:hypothetical protein